MSGDPATAIEHLQAELARDGGATVDVHMLLAEALWQKSEGRGDEAALQHYEAAAKLAKGAGDSTKEGMIALGHGFALNMLGRSAAARRRLEHAKALAEADGNKEAAHFASNILQQVGQADPEAEDSALMRSMWTQFAEAVSADRPAQLFLLGTLARPLDEASSKGVARLRSAGCRQIDFLNVEEPGEHVPEGLQAVSRSPHLTFPQLFLEGKELQGWLDLTAEELRERLQKSGLELGEIPEAEPCHGATAFSDGLEPWEVAVVELVAKEGAGDWLEKAKQLAEHLPAVLAAAKAPAPDLASAASKGELALEAAALEEAWTRLAPIVKDKLDQQPEMPCGHSCATCPTRHDCQLHDAVEGGGIRDIEDLG
jgi:glutaredoxin-related protein